MPKRGLVTIADVKRNDIGATSKAYASAYLGKTALGGGSESAFDADFVTVNAYLGIDGIKPFIDACREYGKGIFVLVKTSNPSSGELQDLMLDDGTVYEKMGDYVLEWGRELKGHCGYSSVGAVVGATWPAQAQKLRERLPGVFFLVPGYGAQGGKAADIAVCFDFKGAGAVVNASRSILTAHQNPAYRDMDFAMAAREEATRMKEDIHNTLISEGKG